MPKGKRKRQTDTNRGAVHYSGFGREPIARAKTKAPAISAFRSQWPSLNHNQSSIQAKIRSHPNLL